MNILKIREDTLKVKLRRECEYINIILKITNNCNLSCKYCYITNKRIDCDVNKIVKAIDSIALNHDKFLDICFHGGEPLLKFDLIKNIISVLETKEYLWRLSLSIQTNGTIISEEIINYLKSKNIGIGISLDGLAEDHNINRVFKNGIGTFDIIKNNLKFLIKKQVECGVLITLNNKNIKNIKTLIEFLNEYNIKFASFNHIITNNNELKINNEELFLMYKDLINYLKLINKYKEKSERLIIRNLQGMIFKVKDKNYRRDMCLCYPCGIGKNVLTIDVDGQLYPCDWLVGNQEYEIKSNNIKELLFETNFIDCACSDCDVNNYCSRGCICKKILLGIKEEELCSFYKKIYKYIEEKLNENENYFDEII